MSADKCVEITPTIDQVMSSEEASFWLKDALRTALMRDPIDAANDAELLANLLRDRASFQLQSATRPRQ